MWYGTCHHVEIHVTSCQIIPHDIWWCNTSCLTKKLAISFHVVHNLASCHLIRHTVSWSMECFKVVWHMILSRITWHSAEFHPIWHGLGYAYIVKPWPCPWWRTMATEAPTWCPHIKSLVRHLAVLDWRCASREHYYYVSSSWFIEGHLVSDMQHSSAETTL